MLVKGVPGRCGRDFECTVHPVKYPVIFALPCVLYINSYSELVWDPVNNRCGSLQAPPISWTSVTSILLFCWLVSSGLHMVIPSDEFLRSLITKPKHVHFLWIILCSEREILYCGKCISFALCCFCVGRDVSICISCHIKLSRVWHAEMIMFFIAFMVACHILYRSRWKMTFA